MAEQQPEPRAAPTPVQTPGPGEEPAARGAAPRRAPQSPHFSLRAPPRSGDSAQVAREGTAGEAGRGREGKDDAGGCGHPLTAGCGPSAGLLRAGAEGAEGAPRAPLTGRSRRGRAGRPPLGVREGRAGPGRASHPAAGSRGAPSRARGSRAAAGSRRDRASWGRGRRRLSAAPRAAEGGRGVPAWGPLRSPGSSRHQAGFETRGGWLGPRQAHQPRGWGCRVPQGGRKRSGEAPKPHAGCYAGS